MSGSQPYPRICAKCKNHGLYSILKGHKHLCIYRECLCPSCRVLVNKRQKRVPQLTQMVKSVTEKNQDESKKNQDSFDYKEKMLGIPLQTEYNDKAYKDEMKIEHLYFIEDKESMPYYPNRDVQCQSSCFQTPGYGKCQFCWCRKQDLLCNTIDFPVSNRGYNNTRFTTLNDPTAVFNRGYNNTHFTTLNNPTAVFNNHAYNTLQSTMVNYPMMHTVNNDVKPQSNSSNYPTTNLINKACLDITGYQTTSHYGVHMATESFESDSSSCRIWNRPANRNTCITDPSAVSHHAVVPSLKSHHATVSLMPSFPHTNTNCQLKFNSDFVYPSP